MQSPVTPSSPDQGLLRHFRALVVALAGVGLAATAHVAGGGSVPSVWTLLLAMLPAGAICWLIGRARWTTRRLFTTCVLIQVPLHLAFAASDPVSSEHRLPMVAGHVMASIATAVLLHRGEDLLWALVEMLGARVLGLLRVHPGRPGGTTPAFAGLTRLRPRVCAAGAEARAPPVRAGV